MASNLELIKVELIDDHPKNPRLVIRDDVVASIVANLDGEWPQQHALHVRPIDGRYQIISGHHRKRAAIVKEIAEVWAFVEAMDDDAAYMLLATSNSQGELSPLEIGVHAYQCVKINQGKRGAGVAAYAARLALDKSTVSQYRSAAEVMLTCLVDQTSCIDKAQHLSAIKGMPKACWQACCDHLISKAGTAKPLSAKDVKQLVKVAKEWELDDDFWKKYLPASVVKIEIFKGKDPKEFNRLEGIAHTAYCELAECPDLQLDWTKWLEGNSGGDSFDKQACRYKAVDLVGEMQERLEKPQVDAIQLILADPPWQYEFSQSDSREIENQYATASVGEICSHFATLLPPVAEDCILYMWSTAPKLLEAIQVMEEWGFEYKSCAVWDKQKIGMGYWFRGQHELLLVGTMGDCSPPDASARVSSVFSEVRGEHSVKPDCVYKAIESMFPTLNKCEMYQRKSRDGWIGVGNESP